MPAFTDRELFRAQILGGVILAVSLLMGMAGAACLKYGIGLPEYMIGVRNMGWALLILSCLWTALATWHRLKL